MKRDWRNRLDNLKQKSEERGIRAKETMKQNDSRKLVSVLLCCALLSLCFACRPAAPSPHAGVYRSVSVERENTSPVQELFAPDAEVVVTLQNGGAGSIQTGDQLQSMKWSVNGASFHAELKNRTIGGILRDGVLVAFDYPNSGEKLTLVCDTIGGQAVADAREALRRAEEIANATPAPTPEPLPYDAHWWNGTWYGWFVVSQGTGKFQAFVGERFDRIAEISTENGVGTMSLRGHEDEEALFTLAVELKAGKTAVGSLTSAEGSSIWREKPYDTWSVEPTDSTVKQFDHMIEITASHTDNDSDTLTYHYFLRPWGMSWEDVRAAAPIEGTLYRNMMPAHYDEWYESAGTFGVLGLHDAKLVGTWYHYSGDSYTFREDGTGVYRVATGEQNFTYMTSENRLTFQFEGNDTQILTTYVIDGRNLVITTSKGRDVPLYK